MVKLKAAGSGHFRQGEYGQGLIRLLSVPLTGSEAEGSGSGDPGEGKHGGVGVLSGLLHQLGGGGGQESLRPR